VTAEHRLPRLARTTRSRTWGTRHHFRAIAVGFPMQNTLKERGYYETNL